MAEKKYYLLDRKGDTGQPRFMNVTDSKGLEILNGISALINDPDTHHVISEGVYQKGWMKSPFNGRRVRMFRTTDGTLYEVFGDGSARRA